MTALGVFGLALSAAVATGGLTALVRRYALARAMVDHPNPRSSHVVPTPRGGGLAIAGVLLGGITALTATGVVSARVGLAVVAGGAAIAAVGWIDDRRGLRPAARLSVHFAAAALAVALLGGLPQLRLGPSSVSLGAAGGVLAIAAIAWLANLYNFMDGIDGIAAGEGAVVGAAATAMLWSAGAAGLAGASALLAGTCLGFLMWNWAPARIFMGDVASGLLGYVLGVLALASERQGAMPALAWIVLLGVFVLDASVTLLRRARRGEPLAEAHRHHAYQRAVQAGWSHARVTSAVLMLTGALVLPAWLLWRLPDRVALWLTAAAAILVVAYVAVERRRPMKRPALPARGK